MATYNLQYQSALDGTFQQRVVIALCNAAVAIMNEANTVPGHALRTAFANKVLLGPDGYKFTCALAILSDGATTYLATTAAGDTDLQARVNALWGGWAGVTN